MTESPDKQPQNPVVGIITLILSIGLIYYCVKLFMA